jgi:hypothetical protein
VETVSVPTGDSDDSEDKEDLDESKGTDSINNTVSDALNPTVADTSNKTDVSQEADANGRNWEELRFATKTYSANDLKSDYID